MDPMIVVSQLDWTTNITISRTDPFALQMLPAAAAIMVDITSERSYSMTMDKNNEKVSSAFGFLSLDMVEPLAEELDAAWLRERGVQEKLRVVLDKYVSNSSYYSESNMLNNDLMARINDSYGNAMRQSILDWIRLCYIYSATDRQLEKIWLLVLARGCAKPCFGIEAELFERLRRINETIENVRSSVVAKLHILKTKPLSRWDDKMLPFLYSDASDIMESVLLQSACNAFKLGWNNQNKLSVEEVVQVNKWGKFVAYSIGLREVDIAKMGLWTGPG